MSHPPDCLCADCIAAKMVALKPKKRAPRKQSSKGEFLVPEDTQRAFTQALRTSGFLGFNITFVETSDKPKAVLADAVAQQVGELTADFEGKGRPELPSPPPSDRYVDAYNSAVRNCNHQGTLQETLYQREWQCLLCGRVVSRKDML